MRYWKFNENNRVIAVTSICEMSPRWTEIGVELFEELKLLRGK